MPISREGRARPSGVKGSRRAPGRDNLWVELPHDPGGPPLQRARTLPLWAFILPQKRGHPSWDLTSFTTSAQQTRSASWDPRPAR